MSKDPESDAKGWWQTLPGILTAGAAFLTAIGGLLVAIHQTGFFNRSPQPAPQTQSASRPTGANPSPSDAGGAATNASPGATGSRPLHLPETTEARSGDSVFKLVSARLDPYSLDKVTLHLTVRMTNNGPFPANFWADSFRLSTGGNLQVPTNYLNQLISPNSAQEGDVDFVIPASTSTVGLQMGDVGEGKPSIPINLQNAQR